MTKYYVKIRPGIKGRWSLTIETPMVIKRFDKCTTVVFIQGPQGLGKTTIARSICEKVPDSIFIEQDQFNGNQTKFIKAFRKQIESRPNVIIVSRCNINITQYQRYVDIVYEYDYCKISFFNLTDSNNQFRTATCKAIATAGMINRSDSKDEIFLGHTNVSLDDAFKWMTRNMNAWTPHQLAFEVPIFKSDDFLEDKLSKMKRKEFISYIKDNYKEIMKLRIPLNHIVEHIVGFFNDVPDKCYVSKSYHHRYIIECASYISFNFEKKYKKILIDTIKKHINTSNGNIMCEHLTQIWKKNIQLEPTIVSKLSNFNDSVQITINAIVVNLKSNGAAYRVTNVIDSNRKTVYIHSDIPHVTAFVPKGCFAKDSLDFVTLDDDSVTVIPVNITVPAKCHYDFR
tara:strand:+ start:146 stop:1342 length:1197 start_codon:yes stop_codon:yes gene_type:complete